jgi:hypothetical protein
MGMFDDVTMLGGQAARTPCAQGHPQRRFQTKDFDPLMDHYIFFEGRLYRESSDSRCGEPLIPPTMRDGDLVLTRESHATPVSFSGKVVVYTHCEECDPVYCEVSDHWNGGIVERPVWIEYELELKDGLLVGIVPIVLTSREELRTKLIGEGQPVLPDDDRVVRRHRELSRARPIAGRP